METHSRALENTAIWKTYLAGLPKSESRSAWVQDICRQPSQRRILQPAM